MVVDIERCDSVSKQKQLVLKNSEMRFTGSSILQHGALGGFIRSAFHLLGHHDDVDWWKIIFEVIVHGWILEGHDIAS